MQHNVRGVNMARNDTTHLERQRRMDDRAASVDDKIDEGVAGVDWKRRRAAEKSFWDWVNAYGFPVLLNYKPPAKSKDVMDKLESSLNMAKPL